MLFFMILVLISVFNFILLIPTITVFESNGSDSDCISDFSQNRTMLSVLVTKLTSQIKFPCLKKKLKMVLYFTIYSVLQQNESCFFYVNLCSGGCEYTYISPWISSHQQRLMAFTTLNIFNLPLSLLPIFSLYNKNPLSLSHQSPLSSSLQDLIFLPLNPNSTQAISGFWIINKPALETMRNRGWY